MRLNYFGNDHGDKIINCDFLPCKGLILTAGKDKTVKVWTKKKMLLMNCVVDEPIDQAVFANRNGDIFISHK